MIITTKRLVASAQKGDVLDFTRFRLHTKIPGHGQVVMCPKCGERGTMSRWLDSKGRRTGGGHITHRKQNGGWCWLPPSDARTPGCASPTPDGCVFAKGTLDGVHYRAKSGWHRAGWHFNRDAQGVVGAMLVGPYETETAAVVAMEAM